MNAIEPAGPTCWICACGGASLKRRGVNAANLKPDDFRITDAGYGMTGDIYECSHCGFLFCPGMGDVLGMYQQMDDPEYEATREERALQAHKLLASVSKFKSAGALLDVGAGSGIMVQAALERGYTAVGVEPSTQLVEQARAHDIPVLPGTLDDQQFPSRFDVVALVDVIEHVEQPLHLLRQAAANLAPDGVCVVISPDVDSLCARLLGKRWWHYRIAHISYFNRKTLTHAVQEAGLEVVAVSRPGWYFPASYLFSRVMQYLPAFMRVRPPRFLDRFTVPLNLFDSLMLVCRHRGEQPRV